MNAGNRPQPPGSQDTSESILDQIRALQAQLDQKERHVQQQTGAPSSEQNVAAATAAKTLVSASPPRRTSAGRAPSSIARAAIDGVEAIRKALPAQKRQEQRRSVVLRDLQLSPPAPPPHGRHGPTGGPTDAARGAQRSHTHGHLDSGGARRDEAMQVVESLRRGPFDFMQPDDDAFWEKNEPYTGTALRTRLVSHSQVQAHMTGRWFLTPSELYAVARRNPPGMKSTDGDFYLDIEGEWITIVTITYKTDILRVQNKQKDDDEERAKKERERLRRAAEAEKERGEQRGDSGAAGGSNPRRDVREEDLADESEVAKYGELASFIENHQKLDRPGGYDGRRAGWKADCEERRKTVPRRYFAMKLAHLGLQAGSSRKSGGRRDAGIGGLSGDAVLTLNVFEDEVDSLGRNARFEADIWTGDAAGRERERKRIEDNQGAFHKLALLEPGAVVAFLNPTLQAKTYGGVPGNTQDVISLRVKRASDVFVIGYASDVGRCEALTKFGKACGAYVDRRLGNAVCEDHLALGVARGRNARQEFANDNNRMGGPFGGKGPGGGGGRPFGSRGSTKFGPGFRGGSQRLDGARYHEDHKPLMGMGSEGGAMGSVRVFETPTYFDPEHPDVSSQAFDVGERYGRKREEREARKRKREEQAEMVLKIERRKTSVRDAAAAKPLARAAWSGTATGPAGTAATAASLAATRATRDETDEGGKLEELGMAGAHSVGAQAVLDAHRELKERQLLLRREKENEAKRRAEAAARRGARGKAGAVRGGRTHQTSAAAMAAAAAAADEAEQARRRTAAAARKGKASVPALSSASSSGSSDNEDKGGAGARKVGERAKLVPAAEANTSSSSLAAAPQRQRWSYTADAIKAMGFDPLAEARRMERRRDECLRESRGDTLGSKSRLLARIASTASMPEPTLRAKAVKRNRAVAPKDLGSAPMEALHVATKRTSTSDAGMEVPTRMRPTKAAGAGFVAGEASEEALRALREWKLQKWRSSTASTTTDATATPAEAAGEPKKSATPPRDPLERDAGAGERREAVAGVVEQASSSSSSLGASATLAPNPPLCASPTSDTELELEIF